MSLPELAEAQNVEISDHKLTSDQLSHPAKQFTTKQELVCTAKVLAHMKRSA